MKICNKKNIVETQNYITLFVTVGVIFLNIYYSWASKQAIILTLYILKYYNALDIIINCNHYTKNQISMLIHHTVVICMMQYLIQLVENNYDYDLYRLARWGMIAEVTSIFNALRYILNKTYFEVFSLYLFGIVFLIGRFIMSFGLYYDMYDNKYILMLSPGCSILIALNSLWSEMIIFKICKKKFTHRNLFQIIAKYHIFMIPYLSIYASNHNKNYLENIIWIYFAHVFCNNYKKTYFLIANI